MNNYYKEIEHLIIKNETNKKARTYQQNNEDLETKWNIGKLLVEAQGGESRAKYGNGLIKVWSKDFTEKYGKGYNISNMKYFRQFYTIFPKSHTLYGQLTWSHIKMLLSIKTENERNYYINLCIDQNLSVRELKQEINNKSYDRLINKPEKIELITNNQNQNILQNLKNPIILNISKNENINNEKELQLIILAQLQTFFLQLGNGFTLVGNEYKIINDGKHYYIDILLFNVKSLCYIVVELKFRELRQTDKGEIELYMNLVDKHIKESFHNKTIGIIISKEQDNFIATYVGEDNIIPLTYKITERN